MMFGRRLDVYDVSCIRRDWAETCLLERGLLAELVYAERVPALSEDVVHALIRGHAMGIEHMGSDRPPPFDWFG